MKAGKEQPIDEKTKQWSGCLEEYTLKTEGGHTCLTVDIDMLDEHIAHFNEAFPKASGWVKQLAEQSQFANFIGVGSLRFVI